jgi:hypothetical protein
VVSGDSVAVSGDLWFQVTVLVCQVTVVVSGDSVAVSGDCCGVR